MSAATPKAPRERGLVELLESPFGFWPAETTLPRERRTPEAPMADHLMTGPAAGHLLPVTPEQLARLPDGVLLYRACHSPIRAVRLDRAHIPATLGHDGARALGVDEGATLVLDDTLTRAAVAALVMPSTRGPHDSVRDGAGHDACCAAVWWPTWLGSVYITPEEVTGHVARVARAAWGSGNVAPASRSPADASTEHALVSLQARAVRS